MEQRRKQERDYIGFGLAAEQESRNIGWGGRSDSENLGLGLAVKAHLMWRRPFRHCSRYLTDVGAATAERRFLRLHKHV